MKDDEKLQINMKKRKKTKIVYTYNHIVYDDYIN